MSLKRDAGYAVFMDPGADKPLLEVATVQCVHCLAGDSKVVTRNGVIDIRNVSPVSDFVLDGSGRFSKVLKKFSRSVPGIHKITTRGGGEPIKASGEHPFWSLEASFRRTNFVIESEPIWRPVSELRKGMWVATQAILEDHVPGEFHGHEVDEEIARFIGLYLAEGWIIRDGIQFGFHKDERDHISFIGDVARRRWGKRVVYSENPGTQSVRLTICSSRLEEACEVFGRGAAEKKIPSEMLCYPRPIQSAMMHGLLDGDGTYSRRRPRRELKTISPHLAYQTYSTLKRLGYSPSVLSCSAYQSTKGVNHRKAYTVTFSIQSPQRRRFVRRSFDYAGHEWVKIIGITDIPVEHEVFNLSVESETFVANGVVTHNCGGHFARPDMTAEIGSQRAKILRVGRGWCINCNGYICGASCLKCVPVEQYLENIEHGRPDDFVPVQVSFSLPDAAVPGAKVGDIWTPS